jgi:Ca-activated chloride channel family protein
VRTNRLPKGDSVAMTEQPGQPSAPAPRPRGRHHRDAPAGRHRALVVLTVVVAIVGAAGLTTWFVRSGSTTDARAGSVPTTATSAAGAATNSSRPSTTATTAATTAGIGPAGPSCDPSGSLRIAAAPDIAGVLTTLAGSGAGTVTANGCTITVVPVDPAEFAAGGTVADVWIPDSSAWIATAQTAGLSIPDSNPSVATSPLVLAVPAATATRIAPAGGKADVASILASRKTAEPVRVGLPDLDESAAAIAAVLSTRAAVTGTPDARAALTWAVRSSPAGMPVGDGELLDRLAADPNTAVPVSEQAVIAHNRDLEGDAGRAVAVYPAKDGTASDYPVIALSTDPQTVAAVADLVALLVGSTGRTALLDAGFRAPDGAPGAVLTTELGVDPGYRVTAPLPDADVISEAIQTVRITNEPSRMLAAIDISGSMQGVVPGAGGATRIDLAKDAAARGLGLYGPDSDIGLWVFSRSLTMTTDYRELIPVSALGPDQQGGTGAQRLSQALAGVSAVPDGGTGLYDTVLDAVRMMRSSYDPSRVNTVLVLSDGMNDDMGSISLDQLLSTLATEQDPTRPVPVISIAFGPDSDIDALSRISSATGGATYESRDPRQIGEIFLDAVGQRLCRPSC